MNYGEIKTYDTANGEGVRVTLFVSGCTRHCPECHNKEAWDFDFGKKFTFKEKELIKDCLRKNYISGLSILGGEPFEHKNVQCLGRFVEEIREEFKDTKNIWVYSGYKLDELVGTRIKKEKFVNYGYSGTESLLHNCDVLVDGEFIIKQKDISLKFRGSSNQRLIDLKKTFDLWKKDNNAKKNREVILWENLAESHSCLL